MLKSPTMDNAIMNSEDLSRHHIIHPPTLRNVCLQQPKVEIQQDGLKRISRRFNRPTFLCGVAGISQELLGLSKA